MLDLKRANFLLSALRVASKNLLTRDKWPTTSLADAAESVSEGAPCEGAPPLSPSFGDRVGSVGLTTEYGLPNDLDLNLPPDVAFPPPSASVESAPGDWQPATGDSPMPTVAYSQHGPGCPEHTIRADYPETPELAELHEIQATQGMDAAVERYKQQQRNRHRRHVITGRKRYAAIALEKNLRLAAERLAEQKLAAKAAQDTLAADAKKSPAFADATEESAAQKEATTA